MFCSDLHREAVKPPPAQPTHRVAVHIPSQQDLDSDSDIEEVRHPHIAFIYSSPSHCISSLSFKYTNMYILFIVCDTAGCSYNHPQSRSTRRESECFFFFRLSRKLKIFILVTCFLTIILILVLRIWRFIKTISSS